MAGLNQEMKTSKELRQQNLLLLVEECNTQRALAAKIGRKEQQVNAWVNGKPIGPTIARLLEQKCKKPAGWMDHEHGVLGVKESVSDYKTQEVVQIPRMDIEGSLGGGIYLPEHEIVVNQVTMLRRWLVENLTFTSLNNLKLITGRGDSMSKTIVDGDPIVVDTGVNEIKLDAVYALARGDELFIKRIQRKLDGSFLVISDNREAYEPYPMTKRELGKIRVCGRALMVWNGRKL